MGPKTKKEHLELLNKEILDGMQSMHRAMSNLMIDRHAQALADRDAAIQERDELKRRLPSERTRNSLAIAIDTEPAVPVEMLMERALERVRLLKKKLEDAHARIAELLGELKNAREAHSVAEQKVDEMLHPKVESKPAAEAPAEVAEVDGPFCYWRSGSRPGEIKFGDLDCDLRAFAPNEEVAQYFIRLLNLGVKSEAMQKRIEELERSIESEREASADIGEAFKAAKADCMETLKCYNTANARADAAEAREKELRELVQRYRDSNYEEGYSTIANEFDDILAGREPNQPAEQAPEATKP